MPRLLLNAATFLLLLAMVTVCTGVASGQVSLTQAVTAATGPTGGCPSIPSAQTTFAPSTNTIWLDYTYTGGTPGDQFQIQWFEPNGSNYATSKYTQSGTGGIWCYEYNIAVLGAAAAGLPGTWTVKLIWNGNQLFSTPFTITAQAPLSDNFTQDSSLNQSLWSTGTPLLKSIAASYPVTLETPNLTFSSAGMTMTGTTGAGQYTGIQSNQSFTPPFSIQVSVTGTVANGNPFYLELMSADLSQSLIVSGNINPNNTGFYGVFTNVDGAGTSVLYASPSVNVLYTIKIAVDVTGTATVQVSNPAGTVLGTQSGLSIGTDSLYLVLAQFEGKPVTVGQNAAIWQQASVTPPVVASSHPAFFTGESSLGGGVYYLQFLDGSLFGYYNYSSSAIIFHYDMGFEGFVPGSANDIYFYDFTSNHWWYTSSSLFPYLYDFTLSNWIYYFPDTSSPGHYTTNPRYFSNLTTGKIFTM